MEATMDDFSSYSDEELITMYHEANHLALIYNIFQLAKKILLNSLYGAVGNNFFRYYNRDMARSITLMGQCMINKAAILKNKFISTILGEKDIKDRRIYSDTDSCAFETLLDIRDSKGNISQIPIGKFYENAIGEETSEDGKYVKSFMDSSEPYEVMSISNDGNAFTSIFHAMKHKVKKHMFKITARGKEVLITEDHSVMVLRDGEFLEISPRDIIKGDKLILSD